MPFQHEYPDHADISAEVGQPVHRRRDFIKYLLAGAATTATAPLASCLPTRFRETTAPTVDIDSTVLSPVSAIRSAQSPEFRQLIEDLRLEEGYAKTLETQKFFGLVKHGEKAPDFAQVMKTFTPRMLVQAQKFHNPTLILNTKGRSFDDLVAAVDAHKTMPRQKDIHVAAGYLGHLRSRARRPLQNWGAYIVDGLHNHYSDDTEHVLQDYLRRFADYNKANQFSGMDRWKCIQLMMQALKEGKPLDRTFLMILDSDPALSPSRVPYALWLPIRNQVSFEFFFPRRKGGVQVHVDQLHRSVGGDVPGV